VNWALLVIGAALVALSIFEALRTTLAVGSVAGPVTGWINHRLWVMVLRTRNRRILRVAGTPLTMNAMAIWLALLWAGWALVFCADPTAVVDSDTGVPARVWDRVYFAGNTMFSLGTGEFVAHGAPWRIASVIALINGLFLVTLAITYIIPVATAATERRRTAALISSLGTRPDDVVRDAWEGDSVGALRHYLMTLAPDVVLLAQRHLAYPVLHYFHSAHVHTAAAPMIARLDEVVSLLRGALREPADVDVYVTRPLHEALTQFLNTLGSAFVDAAETPPPPPSLNRLRNAGLDVVSDEEYADFLKAHDQRRALLLGLVHNDGWTWADVWPPEDEGEHEPTGHGEE
jgi:hypothetical protein